jgi:long-chain acyl-CoA synthetase
MKHFRWHDFYPEGTPKVINPDRYSSLVELLENSFTKFSDHKSFECMGKSMSYRQLDLLSYNFACYLQSLGLEKGDRIGIQLPNVLQYPVAMFGALRAGLIVVNTNPLYTPREMQYQYKDSGTKAVVILANFASKLESIIKDTDIEHVIITEIGDLHSFPKSFLINAAVRYIKKMVPPYRLPTALSFKKALTLSRGKMLKKPFIQSDDVAFLQYTGGTTGVSKGAMLTHRNLIANTEQMSAWMGGLLRERQEIVITALPLYHIFSLTVNCWTMVKIGAHIVLITNPKDLKAFLTEIAKFPFTVISGVNTLYNAMMNHPLFSKINFTELKIAVGGGMAVQSSVAKRWKSFTGCPLIEGYGLTETSPVLSCNPLDGTERIGTIGLVFPNTEMKIVDDQGNDLPDGEAGEIVARGPQVMKGYWEKPEETEKVMMKEGWFKTGDIGVFEDGWFRIVDRKKDMILVSGFNVYPNEIEDVIATHPKVLEVAVVGVPDERSGEAVKAYVVRKVESLTQEELIEFCKQNLTSYKCPKLIEFRQELPKTNVGKILRRALKEPTT